MNYTVGAVQSNKLKIINSIYKAKEAGADLVLFSEYAISGTNCYDLLHKPQFIESCEVALMEIATHCEGICALVGLPVHDDREKGVISVAAFIDNGRVAKFIGKKSILLRDEMSFVSSSRGPESVKIAGEVCDVLLGADAMIKDSFSPQSKILLSLCADPYSSQVQGRRIEYIRQLTYETGKYFVGVNHLGGQVNIIYDGNSGAMNSEGKITAALKSFEEDFVVVDTRSSPVIEWSERDELEYIYKALRLGVRDYFEKSGFAKACLGMSGGIDSAVVYAIAADALGIENVRVIMMPSKFSTDHSVADAVEMAKNLGGEYDIIPIGDMYDVAIETLGPIIGGTQFDNTEENLQARIRAMILMALSNKHGHVLLNTSNKSEIAMGFGTMYGDMAGALSVLGDVRKTWVYKLARYINREREIIPVSILEKAPSAELRHDQKDSDSLPPYDILDAVIYRFMEEGQSVEDIINAGYDDATVHRILESIKFNTYKRYQFCPVLRVSMCPFGAGLLLPLINKYVL